MVNIENLPSAIGWHLASGFNPTNLKSLDLSFNHLYTINGIGLFVSLNSLYLHGNFLKNYGDLKELSKLTELKQLTLHGNPIEQELKNYRWKILALVSPQLQKFDFSLVTKTDIRNRNVLDGFEKNRVTVKME